MIHFFTHGPHIAAVEDAGQATKYAAAGWVRCTADAYRAARKERENAQFDAMRARIGKVRATITPPEDKPGTLIERLKGGYGLYKGDKKENGLV